MKNIEDLFPRTIKSEEDIRAALKLIDENLSEAEWKRLKEEDCCSDDYHNILVNDLGFPQCTMCHLTFDGWEAVKKALEAKYYESGSEYVEERLEILKKVSSKVKRWNKANFAVVFSRFRPDPVQRGYQYISRIFYNPWDKMNKK